MYVKLFKDILTSTIWMEEDHIVRVWLTFLLLADHDGFIEMPVPAIAQQARVSLSEATDAIAKLEAPDEYSRTSEEDGRRIIRITEEKTLWFIVNLEHYRSIRNKEQKKAYQREYMRSYRARKKKELTGEDKTNELAHTDIDTDTDTEKETHTSVFETEFWSRWPKGRKIDKKKCERKFDRLTKKQQAAATGPGYQAWLDHWATIDTQFIPHPMTYLNAERWESSPPTKKGVTNHQETADQDVVVEEHKKSCDHALEIVSENFGNDLHAGVLTILDTVRSVIKEAREMPAGEGYRKIVGAEDLLLDFVSDEYELEAPTTTERRKLAREKIGLPVLY